MGLAGKVCGTADDIVLSRKDVRNEGGTLHRSDTGDPVPGDIVFRTGYITTCTGFGHFRQSDENPVTDGDRVGRRASFLADPAPEHCREKVPSRRYGQKIMASGMFYYYRFHTEGKCSKNSNKYLLLQDCKPFCHDQRSANRRNPERAF